MARVGIYYACDICLTTKDLLANGEQRRCIKCNNEVEEPWIFNPFELEDSCDLYD